MKTRAAVALEVRQYPTINEAGLEAPESGGLLAHIASAGVRETASARRRTSTPRD